MPHYWRDLKTFPGSFARLSDHAGTRTAVVFVHGFFGNASDTWVDFHSLVEDAGARAEFETSDLYFYSYPSSEEIVVTATQALAGFVHAVFPRPSPELFRIDATVAGILGQTKANDTPRPTRNQYSELVLVGHSLGGVLVRQLAARSVLQPYKVGPTTAEIQKAGMALFAPAQAGFRLADDVKAAIDKLGVLSFVWTYFTAIRAKAYNDLVPGSPILQKIEEQTRLAVDPGHGKSRCFNAHTMWGDQEIVVWTADYTGLDTVCDPLPANKGHVDVCKPSTSFPTPITWVADAIERSRQAL